MSESLVVVLALGLAFALALVVAARCPKRQNRSLEHCCCKLPLEQPEVEVQVVVDPLSVSVVERTSKIDRYGTKRNIGTVEALAFAFILRFLPRAAVPNQEI